MSLANGSSLTPPWRVVIRLRTLAGAGQSGTIQFGFKGQGSKALARIVASLLAQVIVVSVVAANLDHFSILFPEFTVLVVGVGRLATMR